LKRFNPLFENQNPPASFKEFLKRLDEDERICKGLNLSENEFREIFQYLKEKDRDRLPEPSDPKEKDKAPSFILPYLEDRKLYRLYDELSFNERHKPDYMYLSPQTHY